MTPFRRWSAVCVIAAISFIASWVVCQVFIGLDADFSTAIAGALMALVTVLMSSWASQGISNDRQRLANRLGSAARREYLRRLRHRYNRVDLEVLTPLNDQDEYPPVPLLKVFVPQQVKADPPPMELPREVTLRMRESDTPDSRPLPEVVSPAQLSRIREYEQRSPVDVLPLIAEQDRRMVVLGDPGSGKSTLARFLTRMLAEPRLTGALTALDGWLPILVELREYAQQHDSASRDFLDFAEEQFDVPKAALERYLEDDGRALVVFDGLDEIFDAALRDRVARQIAGFAERYPNARIVVTSRPVGYHKSALESVGFTRYKLQDLDQARIATFVRRWYAIACQGNTAEAARLERRLADAIRDSAAVRELAGNPMLLTILAIIGRRQALPRDRASVYDHAVTVLVEQWDPSKFLVSDPVEGLSYLQRADRMEMLRLIARKLQHSAAGLQGNFISGADLMAEFVAFLRQRDPVNVTHGQASAAAERMLRQFHDRNFILSRFGGEVYGFVHRSFLEYLTAADIVHRFNRERSISEEELIEGYFGRRCREPAWHEVLQLTAGMLDERFVNLAVRRMLAADPHWAASDQVEPHHILVAIRCIGEVRKIGLLEEACEAAIDAMIRMLTVTHRRVTRTYSDSLNQVIEQSVLPVVAGFAPYWPGRERYLAWFLRNGFIEADDAATCATATRLAVTLYPDDPRLRGFLRTQASQGWSIYHRAAAGAALMRCWPDDPENLRIVRAQCDTDPSWEVRHGAVRAIVAARPRDRGTLDLLRDRLVADEHGDVRRTAVRALATHWREEPRTLTLITERAVKDEHEDIRLTALQAIAERWRDAPASLPLLRNRAAADPQEHVRRGALLAIVTAWAGTRSTLSLLKERAQADPSTDVRRAALTAVAQGWPDDTTLLNWLRAQCDENPSVRQAAVNALAGGWREHPRTLPFLLERLADDGAEVRQAAVQAIAAGRLDADAAASLRGLAEHDPSADVRQVAVEAVATHLRHDEQIRQWLRQRARADDTEYVRSTAVRLLADSWNDDPLIEMWMHETASTDPSAEVRRAALRAVAIAGRDDSDTRPWLLRRAVDDGDVDVRLTAVQFLADGWQQAAGFQAWLRERCVADPAEDVRNVAMRALIAGWHDDPQTLPLLRERARLDGHEYIRRAAVWMIADGWPDDPESLSLLRDCATKDPHEIVRRAATQAIAVGWHDDPGTLPLLLQRATDDHHEHVRAGVVRAIASGWHEKPATRELLYERSTTDGHQAVRLLILQIIISGWASNAETRATLHHLVVEDPAPAVRLTGVQALVRYWRADARTLDLLRRVAAEDPDPDVRRAAATPLP